jgi:hypothetical protein
MLIAAADTLMDRSSADLMAAYYPDVPIRGPLEGYASLMSSNKALRLLGYTPRHSWRNGGA